VTDFDRCNRFGNMLMLDVPDEKLLTLAKEIPEGPKNIANTASTKKVTKDEPVDIT
jgi:hypothetical protein